jgi:hypothetical protein
MPLTLPEGIALLPTALTFAEKAEAAIAALPPKDTAKPSDYLNMAAAILTAAGPLGDQLAEKIKS